MSALARRRSVEEIMAWLQANGVTDQANEIIEGSLHADDDYIWYETIKRGIRSGIITVPHRVKPGQVHP